MVIATISLNLVDQIFDRVNWSFKTLYGEKGGEVCLMITIKASEMLVAPRISECFGLGLL